MSAKERSAFPVPSETGLVAAAYATENAFPCTRCHESYSRTQEFFKPNSRGKDGLSRWCRTCQSAYDAAWHQKNKERRQKAKRAWYKRNPEKLAAEKKRFQQRNRDKINAYHRGWYHRYPARFRQYEAKHRDYYLAWKRAYYAANRSGKPSDLATFLVRFTDKKCCKSCRRIKSLLEFDPDGRTKDGYTKSCVQCLPPKRTAPGGYVRSLDSAAFRSPDSPSLVEYCSDKSAVSPEEQAITTELWDFFDTLPAVSQRLLDGFMETLDLETAATQCGISISEASGILQEVRTLAQAKWGGIYA